MLEKISTQSNSYNITDVEILSLISWLLSWLVKTVISLSTGPFSIACYQINLLYYIQTNLLVTEI